MGYRGKKGNSISGGFVQLPWDMLNSNAYIDLPPSSAKALPYFLGKVKIPYSNPDKHLMQFNFTYSEAKQFGFASTTFYRSISELIAKGFIDPVSKGGKRSSGYSSSRFKLSDRWKKYETENFKETKSWSEFYQSK